MLLAWSHQTQSLLVLWKCCFSKGFSKDKYCSCCPKMASLQKAFGYESTILNSCLNFTCALGCLLAVSVSEAVEDTVREPYMYSFEHLERKYINVPNKCSRFTIECWFGVFSLFNEIDLVTGWWFRDLKPRWVSHSLFGYIMAQC